MDPRKCKQCGCVIVERSGQSWGDSRAQKTGFCCQAHKAEYEFVWEDLKKQADK